LLASKEKERLSKVLRNHIAYGKVTDVHFRDGWSVMTFLKTTAEPTVSSRFLVRRHAWERMG
jgi:hypothetical protein